MHAHLQPSKKLTDALTLVVLIVPVYVRVDVTSSIVVDDSLDGLYVKATCSNISGHQQVLLP